MSEQQMNDNTFSRLFIIMTVTLVLLTIGLMILAVTVTGGVTDKLDEQKALENEQALVSRIAPVGTITGGAKNDAQTANAVQEEAQETGPVSGAEVYQASCSACHAVGIASAPRLGNKSDWNARIKKGIQALYKSGIDGISDKGFMPPKGGNPNLSDEQVKAAVDYMVEQVK